MTKMKESDVPNLIKMANNQGLKLSLANGSLVVRFTARQSPDSKLIELLSENKLIIMKYLADHFFFNDEFRLDRGNSSLNETIKLYRATSVQEYWLDDSLDSEFKAHDTIHGKLVVVFDIKGFFDIKTFKQSVMMLIERHESLRANFQKVHGSFNMSVDEYPSIDRYLEVLSGSTNYQEQDIESFVNFDDHQFDLQDGPLFLVRVYRQTEDSYIFSIKIHHVICDGYSYDIIIRDLFLFYQHLLLNVPLKISPLKLQLKHFMEMENNYIHKNYDADEAYWLNKFNFLPSQLSIPGIINHPSKMSEQFFDAQRCDFSPKVASKVANLSNDMRVSAFIILQAALGCFLFELGNPNDICFGTYLLGRDFPGMEEQVGCFANTKLIRYILKENLKFNEVIEIVTKANEDLVQYRACTAREIIEKIGPPEFPNRWAFWNINIQFAYAKKILASKSEATEEERPLKFTISKRSLKPHRIMPIDLQLQFTNSPESLHLDAQFNAARYSKTLILKFIKDFEEYLVDLSNDSYIGVSSGEFSKICPN